jgi:hypothetical protein
MSESTVTFLVSVAAAAAAAPITATPTVSGLIVGCLTRFSSVWLAERRSLPAYGSDSEQQFFIDVQIANPLLLNLNTESTTAPCCVVTLMA